MKKEISDHLARTFFDKKSKPKEKKSRYFVLVVMAVVALALSFGIKLARQGNSEGFSALGERVSLEKHDGPYILRFDFTNRSTPVQSLNIELPDFDLSRYHYLKFSARLAGTEVRRLGVLKISLMNRLKETAHTYSPQLNQSWKIIKIPLSQFEALHDRAGFLVLSYTLEEWNVNPKKGEVLIDGIEFSNN